MKTIYTLLGILLVFSLFFIGVSLQKQGNINEKMVGIEEKKLSIEQEKHIDNLFSIYQENMSICKKNATEQGKNNDYIKENCINVINDSIIANWLKDRGYGNLIKE